jgi:DNA-binding MurR/RpiR family transcriptional regulator
VEDFVHKLRQYAKSGTPAERRIAKYFTEHLNDLPFETAASVADRLDLSPMTVGRFLRALGYQGLDSVKFQIRETSAVSATQMQASMNELQTDAAEGKPLAVAMIGSAREIFVATHAALSGFAAHFCQQLTQARDGVHALNGTGSRFAELFARLNGNEALVIIIDSRRFGKARLLARTARRYGYKVILITAQSTNWMPDQANLMLPLPAPRAGDTDNLPPLMALLDCLSTAAVAAAGEEASLRTRRMAEFGVMLGEGVGG